MNRGERLKERRLQLNLTYRRAAELLNISIAGVQNLERGDTMPNLELGMKIAKFYEKSIEWVLNGSNCRDDIPIVGNTQAGPDNNWIGDIYADNYSFEYIDMSPKGHRLYALRVVGDSMVIYQEGDIVLVNADAKPIVGEDVVVQTSRDETMIKKLARIDDNQIFLDSTNDQYKRIIRDLSEVTLMHPVIGSVKSYMAKHR